MPPKLQLNINASVQGVRFSDDVEQQAVYAPSIEIMPGGALKLYKSFQAYEFNPLGMVRPQDMTSPLAAGAAAMQQSYKISEGDVRVVRTLGQGASGLVQKAFLPRESRFVAIKKINILEREKRHQLMNDIKALCNAPSMDGLIRFYGAYHAADKGQIAVVLEYMDGGSLADVLAKVKKIPEDVLAAITLKILPALAYMHSRHMVHRDIKPANILMATSGEAKLSDFGISAFMDNTIAQCHTFLGTVTYMSPERINGKAYSVPADIWALGLVLLECATGRYPYDASGGTIPLMIQLIEEECPMPAAGPGFSPELRDFIAQCMRKDPWQRPTASALLQHPFLTRRAAAPVDLRSFMSCMHNVEEKTGDAVTILTSRFYNNLAYNAADSDSIAAFYASDAQFTYCGESLRGKYTIAKQLHGFMRTASKGLGAIVFVVDRLDYQPLQGSAEEVVVQARVAVLRDRPAAADEPAEPLASFADSFVVRLSSLDNALPGVGFTITNHIFRWLRPLQPKKQSVFGGQKCRVQ